jgi:hypothetical protein
MALSALLRCLNGRSSKTSQGPRRRRLGLEVLEGRWLPSTLTVSDLTDNAADPHSLRGAITAASSGDTINFAPALSGHTIALTSGYLVITKNLTIVGPGAS